MSQCSWEVIRTIALQKSEADKFIQTLINYLNTNSDYSIFTDVDVPSLLSLFLNDKISNNCKDLAPEPTENNYYKITARGTVQLHPSNLHQVKKGVDLYLNRLLTKYVREFDGLWIAYKPQVKYLDTLGHVCDAERFAILTFPVEVDCLILRIKEEGVIKFLRPMNIIALVFGLISVCIQTKDCSHKFTYDNGIYRFKNNFELKSQSTVNFQVTKVIYIQDDEFISLEGKLLMDEA